MLTCRSVQFRSARVSIFCRGGIASSAGYIVGAADWSSAAANDLIEYLRTA